MRIILFLFLFFTLSALLIISNNNLAFSNPDNLLLFKQKYISWLGNIYFKVQNLTGNIIRANWLPG